jgi:hypothetical protein
MSLRDKIEPLYPMPTCSLDTRKNVWELMMNEASTVSQARVGRPDMNYFTIADSGFHGLAASQIKQGDEIWHFPGKQLVFTVRMQPGHGAIVTGRAYLFTAGRKADTLEPWLSRSFDYNAVRRGERHISMDLATLLELSSLAVSTKNVDEDVLENTNGKKFISGVKAGWKAGWPYQILLAGSSKFNSFLTL